jgi:hypothetical protein
MVQAQREARLPDLRGDIGQILVTEEDLRAKVRELGALV